MFSKSANASDLTWDSALLAWLILGPLFFLLSFASLLLDEKRKARRNTIIDKYPPTKLEEFSTKDAGHTIGLSVDQDDKRGITLKASVSFRNRQYSDTERPIRFNVCFERKGRSKINIIYDEADSRTAREIAEVVSDADPPIVPIKWKSGVLTISDAGMEYTEGPYDLGPVADNGIVGNLTIVEGLKSVVDEVEAIWMASSRDGESKT